MSLTNGKLYTPTLRLRECRKIALDLNQKLKQYNKNSGRICLAKSSRHRGSPRWTRSRSVWRRRERKNTSLTIPPPGNGKSPCVSTRLPQLISTCRKNALHDLSQAVKTIKVKNPITQKFHGQHGTGNSHRPTLRSSGPTISSSGSGFVRRAATKALQSVANDNGIKEQRQDQRPPPNRAAARPPTRSAASSSLSEWRILAFSGLSVPRERWCHRPPRGSTMAKEMTLVRKNHKQRRLAKVKA
jgi:hypothetical protein